MKRVLPVILAVVLTLAGCTSKIEYMTKTFTGYMDTVISYATYAQSDDDFAGQCALVKGKLVYYDALFDIYDDAGMNNVKTINDNAGKKAVRVDDDLYELIEDAIEYNQTISSKVNIACGALTALWHEAREAANDKGVGTVPAESDLKEAARHIDIDDIVLDEEKKSVYLKDEDMSLDVGAVAKGFAMEKIKDALTDAGVTTFLLNGGGNVVAVGERAVAKSGSFSLKACKNNYCVGILSPQDGNYASGNTYEAMLVTKDKAVVTSGDYERYFTDSDGNRYCHIIDPDTLHPAENMRSVTIVCADSAKADFLSSALFMMTYEDGLERIESMDDAEAIWLLTDGKIRHSSGLTDETFAVVDSDREE